MNRRKVKIIPAAYADLKEARDWYREQQADLPKRFTLQVKVTIERLRTLPVSNAIRYKGVRIANIPVFPYAIHYLLENEKIIILAIHHTAINPSGWEERL